MHWKNEPSDKGSGKSSTRSKPVSKYTFEDLVEQKNSEESRGNSAKDSHNLPENINDYVAYVTDMKGVLIYISPVIVTITGFGSEELIGRNYFGLIYKEDLPLVKKKFKNVLAGDLEPIEFRIKTKTGKIHWVRSTSRPIRKGKDFSGLRGVLTDITERKRVEEKIKRVHNVFFPVIRTINQLIVNEKCRDKLLEGVCKTLVHICGYTYAWIALFEKTGGFITIARTGKSKSLSPIIKLFKIGKLTECVLNAFSRSDPVVILQPLVQCKECSLAKPEKDKRIICMRLEHEGTIYGVMTASVPEELISEKDEQESFKKIADNLAFGLHNIELEKEREKAQESLRDTMEKLKEFETMVNRSQALVFRWRIAPGWPVEFVSENVKQQLGYTPEELLSGRVSWVGITYPDDVPRLEAEVADYTARGITEFTQEYRLITRSGEVRWVVDRTMAIIDSNGKVTHYQGIILDNTERKLAEEKLHYRLELEKLVTSISTKFINLAPDEIDREISLALEQIGKFGGADRCFVLIISPDRKKISNTYEWCAQGIPPYVNKVKDLPVWNYPWINKKLNRHQLVYVPSVANLSAQARMEKAKWQSRDIKSLIAVPLIFSHSLVGYLGFEAVREEKKWENDDIRFMKMIGEIIVNALEHKRVQEALKKVHAELELRVEERTAALLDSESQLKRRIKELTCQYNIRREFDREISLEKTLQACLAHIKDAFLDSENKIIVLDLDQQIFNSDSNKELGDQYLEKILLINNERRGYLRVYSGPDGNWELPFERDLLNEITEILSAYIQRRELKERLALSEKLAATGRLAAGVAHEINNPLGAVKNSLYIIKRALPPKHQDYEYVELMEREIDRVSSIIAQLYDLYRPAAQEPRWIDLEKLVENVLKMLDIKIRTHKIKVKKEPCTKSTKLNLPLNQVTQVLYNIIENAVQAMPGGGELGLSCHRYRKSLRLTVSDTGEGINPNVLPHIFEPFFTTKAKGGSVSGGMGMGLSISNSIMESLGGSIQVETRLYRGTKIILNFPASRIQSKPKKKGKEKEK